MKCVYIVIVPYLGFWMLNAKAEMMTRTWVLEKGGRGW